MLAVWYPVDCLPVSRPQPAMDLLAIQLAVFCAGYLLRIRPGKLLKLAKLLSELNSRLRAQALSDSSSFVDTPAARSRAEPLAEAHGQAAQAASDDTSAPSTPEVHLWN